MHDIREMMIQILLNISFCERIDILIHFCAQIYVSTVFSYYPLNDTTENVRISLQISRSYYLALLQFANKMPKFHCLAQRMFECIAAKEPHRIEHFVQRPPSDSFWLE